MTSYQTAAGQPGISPQQLQQYFESQAQSMTPSNSLPQNMMQTDVINGQGEGDEGSAFSLSNLFATALPVATMSGFYGWNVSENNAIGQYFEAGGDGGKYKEAFEALKKDNKPLFDKLQKTLTDRGGQKRISEIKGFINDLYEGKGCASGGSGLKRTASLLEANGHLAEQYDVAQEGYRDLNRILKSNQPWYKRWNPWSKGPQTFDAEQMKAIEKWCDTSNASYSSSVAQFNETKSIKDMASNVKSEIEAAKAGATQTAQGVAQTAPGVAQTAQGTVQTAKTASTAANAGQTAAKETIEFADKSIENLSKTAKVAAKGAEESKGFLSSCWDSVKSFCSKTTKTLEKGFMKIPGMDKLAKTSVGKTLGKAFSGKGFTSAGGWVSVAITSLCEIPKVWSAFSENGFGSGCMQILKSGVNVGVVTLASAAGTAVGGTIGTLIGGPGLGTAVGALAGSIAGYMLGDGVNGLISKVWPDYDKKKSEPQAQQQLAAAQQLSAQEVAQPAFGGQSQVQTAQAAAQTAQAQAAAQGQIDPLAQYLQTPYSLSQSAQSQGAGAAQNDTNNFLQYYMNPGANSAVQSSLAAFNAGDDPLGLFKQSGYNSFAMLPPVGMPSPQTLNAIAQNAVNAALYPKPEQKNKNAAKQNSA